MKERFVMIRRLKFEWYVIAVTIVLIGLTTALQARPLTTSEAAEVESLLLGSAATASDFIESFTHLSDTVTEDFLGRFLALEKADAEMTLAIFNAGFGEAHSERDRGKLLRGSIMISDIHENVRHVAQTGDIREIDGRMESTGILRFVSRTVEDFPTTRSVITDEYIASLQTDYEAAALAIDERGALARASADRSAAIADRDAEFVRLLRIELDKMDGIIRQLQSITDRSLW